ncbi:hypothetical protein, partial [Thiolapillus sp.]|uniref:hypothetical protein n=1 Tax=Thiolapillus sp. TaxID=2017437 RepID=UPI003AF60825
MNKLQLPPGISVKRRGNAYAIFRNEYEEIGGVVVRGTSLGVGYHVIIFQKGAILCSEPARY